jgi:hypothetical protein
VSDRQNYWTTRIEPKSKEDFSTLIGECNDQKKYCDVVTLIEADEGDSLTIELKVESNHQQINNEQIHTKIDKIYPPCNMAHAGGGSEGRDRCLKTRIFPLIVNELAGLEDTHAHMIRGN